MKNIRNNKMAVTVNKIEYNIIRSLTTISIITLIVISVYHLNMTLECLKKLIDQIEHTDSVYERQAAKNETLAKKMFETMQRNAQLMYEKHEPAILMNIIIYTSIIAFSMAGLIAALRDNKIMLFIYAIALDLLYLTSFLYCTRLPSLHCSLIVFVSIIVFMRTHHLWKRNLSDKIHLLQATNTINGSNNSNNINHQHQNIDFIMKHIV